MIIDFGVCDIVSNANERKRKTYNVGSPGYMSPEAYNQSEYSEKSDIWSLGIVLF